MNIQAIDTYTFSILPGIFPRSTGKSSGAYEALFGEINARVDEYKILLAKEEGRQKKKNDTNINTNPLNDKQDE